VQIYNKICTCANKITKFAFYNEEISYFFAKKRFFSLKNLVNSKKSSIFAVRFEPLAIALDGLRVTGYRLPDSLE